MMPADFVPMYREVKNFNDVDHNQQQMIMAFNHGMTKLGKGMEDLADSNKVLALAQVSTSNDTKWIKRIMFSVAGFMSLILVAAICDMAGWVPA